MNDAFMEELDLDTCLRLLRSHTVGRIGVVVDGFPLVVPVNYRLMEAAGRTWVVLRTRPDNVIDTAGERAAFEIDGIDATHQSGWSVAVRGTLAHIDPTAAAFRDRFDPEPWIEDGRDAWIAIEPFSITGRVLHTAEVLWAFDTRAYL